MHEFLSLLRFYEFNGDMEVLNFAKAASLLDCEIQKAHDKLNEGELKSSVHQDEYKATNVLPISIENELKVWAKIEEMVTESLGRYETSLEQDNYLLEKDDKYRNLSYNERNCILFR